jgi:hypothetical protein
MQKKNNAPLNNQPKEPTERKTKKKVTFHQENCLPKNAFTRIRNKRTPPPLRPIHSQ